MDASVEKTGDAEGSEQDKTDIDVGADTVEDKTARVSEAKYTAASSSVANTKDYSGFAALKGMPRIGDTLAFKV